MDYLTHNDLWWVVISERKESSFQRWVNTAGWDDELVDGPLDAPVGSR